MFQFVIRHLADSLFEAPQELCRGDTAHACPLLKVLLTAKGLE
jgi:hypothetical protein